jgi:hypothetical protein
MAGSQAAGKLRSACSHAFHGRTFRRNGPKPSYPGRCTVLRPRNTRREGLRKGQPTCCPMRVHREVSRLLDRLDCEIAGRLDDDRSLATDPGDDGGPVFVIMAPAWCAFLAPPTCLATQQLFPTPLGLILLASGVIEFIGFDRACQLAIGCVGDGRMQSIAGALAAVTPGALAPGSVVVRPPRIDGLALASGTLTVPLFPPPRRDRDVAGIDVVVVGDVSPGRGGAAGASAVGHGPGAV